tara:strand:+ start:241 stop:510 length:270 start_codon:yes stop_codon:yes gene_type:complete
VILCNHEAIERLYGRGIGLDRAVLACAEQGRSTAQMADARDVERDPEYSSGLPGFDASRSDAPHRLPGKSWEAKSGSQYPYYGIRTSQL